MTLEMWVWTLVIFATVALLVFSLSYILPKLMRFQRRASALEALLEPLAGLSFENSGITQKLTQINDDPAVHVAFRLSKMKSKLRDKAAQRRRLVKRLSER
jgi:hypothetical protein